jgi:hypothetical protein
LQASSALKAFSIDGMKKKRTALFGKVFWNILVSLVAWVLMFQDACEISLSLSLSLSQYGKDKCMVMNQKLVAVAGGSERGIL